MKNLRFAYEMFLWLRQANDSYQAGLNEEMQSCISRGWNLLSPSMV